MISDDGDGNAFGVQVAEETVRRSDQIRPIDCVKIFNSVASLVRRVLRRCRSKNCDVKEGVLWDL